MRRANPFGPRIRASSYEGLADAGNRALDAGRLDLGTVLALQYESGCIAATQGRRLILFLGLNAAIRRAIWEFGTAEIQRQGLGHEAYVELGEWLVLTTEMSSLAVGEGYRATERELLARDAAARRAAIDELLGAVPVEGRAASRLRRLAMRYRPGPRRELPRRRDPARAGRRPDAGAARHRRCRPRDDGPADRRAAPTSRPPRRREHRDPGPAGPDLARRHRGRPWARPARVATAAGGRGKGVRVGGSVVDRDRHAGRRRDRVRPVTGRAPGGPPGRRRHRPARRHRRPVRARHRAPAAERPRARGRHRRAESWVPSSPTPGWARS